ncbi:MAG TPA: trigger factor [Myxococcaceae bacterium]|nr:trigger factor [Myxococcaceae bacterium]
MPAEEKLEVKVEESSPIERTISITVPASRVKKRIDNAYWSLGATVRMPGFRQGKVPRRMLEQRYRQSVEDQVVRELLEKAYLEAIEEHSVEAVASPSLSNGGFKANEPFTFTARVQVRPKVDPTDYDGLELTKREAKVTDQQVEERMEAIRQRMVKLEPIQGRDVAKQGDYAMIDYTATVDGAEFPGNKAENVKVEIAPGEMIHSKCAALEGVKVGETKTLDYTFPADYQVAEVKGKTAQFQITIRDLRAQITPELNDDFAKEIGGGQTVAEMREKVRNDLLTAERNKLRTQDRDEVVAQVLKRNPFEVPEAMVEHAVDSMLQSALRSMARSGLDPSQLRMDYQALRGEMKDKASLEVKGTLALEAICRKENIDVSSADVEAKIQELAKETSNTVDTIQNALDDPSVKRQFYEKLREEKTIEFLKGRAKYS